MFHTISSALPAFVYTLLLTSPVFANGPIPPQMFSEERAGIFNLDRELLQERLNTKLDRCQMTTGEGYDQVSCLLLEGMSRCLSGDRDAGLAAFREGINLLEGMNDRFGIALFYVSMAEAERQMQHPAEAIRIYSSASVVLESLVGSTEPIRIESFRLFAELAGMPEVFTKQMAPMAPMISPLWVKLFETMTRDRFGTLLLAENQVPEAEEQLKLALSGSHSLSGILDAQVLDHLGQVRERQDKFTEARDFFRQALDAARRNGDLERRFSILSRLAEVEIASGNLSEALATLESARQLAHEQGDLAREASLLTNLSDFHYHQQGDVDRARHYTAEALQVAAKSGDPWAIAVVQDNAGGVALITGAYEKAAKHFELASSTLNAMESWRPEVALMQANALMRLIQVYPLLGRHQRMSEKAIAAQELAHQNGFPEGVAIGRFLEETLRFVDAKAQDSEADASSLRQAATDLHQALKASDVLSLRQASKILGPALENMLAMVDPKGHDSLRIQDQRVETTDRTHLLNQFSALAAAQLEMAAGRYEETRRLLEELLCQLRKWEQQDYEASALAMIAGLHWKNGEAELAVRHALEAIEVLEALVGGFHVDDLLSAFQSSHRQLLYQIAIEILSRSDKLAEAFQMAERARARTLLHQLGNQRLNTFDQDPDLLGRLDELRRDILALEGNPSARAAVHQKREQYGELLIRAKLRHPEYTELVSVEPVDLATLQGSVLPPETSLVAYYVSSNRILAWIIDREQIEMVSLPMTSEELEGIVCLADGLSHRSSRGTRPLAGCAEQDGLKEKYFAKLVAPLLPKVRHDRLILVPHGSLHYVPFAALRDSESGRFLLEMKTISYTPSVSTLRFLAEKGSLFDGKALVLGDPKSDLEELPWARDEAISVAELFGTEPLLGAEATESLVRASAGQIDLLHLAAHGVYRPRTPRFSHIALTAGGDNDGRLEVEEVFSRLDLRGVNLVTLSGCQTALGERTNGDEIIGLTRAFLYAGSPAVVSTLWRVDDEATAFLMKAFYEGLLKEGMAYAEALRAAQLKTLSQPGWDDPYCWAAFTLNGDPTGSWDLENSKLPLEGGR